MSNNQKSQSNLGVSILYLFGFLLAIYSIAAYITHLLGYKLRVYGADMPTLDMLGMVVCLLIAAMVYGAGYFFDKYSK